MFLTCYRDSQSRLNSEVLTLKYFNTTSDIYKCDFPTLHYFYLLKKNKQEKLGISMCF